MAKRIVRMQIYAIVSNVGRIMLKDIYARTKFTWGEILEAIERLEKEGKIVIKDCDEGLYIELPRKKPEKEQSTEKEGDEKSNKTKTYRGKNAPIKRLMDIIRREMF